MNRLIILRGLPGSGKSTFSERFPEAKIISKDNFRVKDGVYSFDPKKENEIQKKHDLSFQKAIEQSLDTIILDSLHLSATKVKNYIDEGNKHGYNVISVNFRSEDLNLNAKRNSHNVSFDEIKRMSVHYDEYPDECHNVSIRQDNYKGDCDEAYRKIIEDDFEGKSTNAEIELRVSAVSEMIIKGQGREKICRYASKEWNVSDRTVDRYISRAWEKIERNTDFDVKQELKLQRARFEDLYGKNYTIQDYRECRQVLDSIGKLLGLGSEKDNGMEQYIKMLANALQPIPEAKESD